MNFQTFITRSLTAGAMALLATSLVPNHVLAQQDFSNIEIKTIKVAGNIHMLVGRGGNIAVVSGDDGLFMVDDQFAPLSAKIKTAIKAISDQPIKFLLNTHWHSDHTGGNANFAKDGATIVAHENVRKLLSADQVMKAFNNRPVPAAPKSALPVITFKDGASFHMNGETMAITHLPNAHTGGDSFVQFKNANVIHTGDTFFNGFYPFIDVQHGGSINGLINAANTILKVADDQTKIIPGHGPLGDKAALIRYRDMLMQLRDSVAAAMTGGKSVEEVIAAAPTKALDRRWGGGFLKPPVITRIVYSSLK